MEMEEPRGSSVGSLIGGLIGGRRGNTSWAPSREWPDVRSTPGAMKKAIQEVGETLEQPSARSVAGATV